MSKKIDYDKIVRDSFAKAQQDLGFKKSILSETDGVVHWHTAYNLKPFEFPL